MSRSIKSLFIFLTLCLVSCEKSDKMGFVDIKTGKTDYSINTKIGVTFSNYLGCKANYAICNNSGPLPTEILIYKNGNWVDSTYYTICTAIGPSGYFGVINMAEIKHDTLILVNYTTGKFKLRYPFVVNKDTLHFDSNEFNVN